MVSESVQGLSSGSAVKFQGVPVGIVRDITISTKSQRIRIDMEVRLSKFKTSLGTGAQDMDQTAFYHYLEQEIPNGLRCKLESEGITGSKYIEFEFVPGLELHENAAVGFDRSNVFFVPSVPSLLSDLSSNVQSLLSKLEEIDYKGISDETKAAVQKADQLLSDPRLDQMIANLYTASRNIVEITQNVQNSVTPEKMNGFISKAESAVDSLKQAASTVETQMRNAHLQEMLEELRGTLKMIQRSSYAFLETMSKVNAGVDSASELIEYLDANPASLIQGKGRSGTSSAKESVPQE